MDLELLRRCGRPHRTPNDPAQFAMKVLVVFGTRPEAIKLAPVIRELARRAEESDLNTVVCVTGQHREMLDQVLGLFAIKADHDLDLMEDAQTPTRVASTVLSSIEPIMQRERPDWVVVQGDTTTVAAVSIAAFYARVKVAHVEAGLRTHNKKHPFPEEANRRIASVVADLHCAPTGLARDNLLREGVAAQSIVVTGNPVIDALYEIVDLPVPTETQYLLANLSDENRATSPKVILVTAHRRENFGGPLENICLALRELARRYGRRVRIVYPVHLNPQVHGPVHRVLNGLANVDLVPPLDYLSLVQVMRRSFAVLTDSGGIQEEAPSLGKPVLVLREVTERPEAVEAGTVKMIGTDRDRIVAETASLLDDPGEYRRMAQSVNPYGDGQASRRIVAALLGEPVDQFEPAEARST